MLKTKLTLAVLLTASLMLAASCASRQVTSTADGLSAVLETIEVGQSKFVSIVGEMRPYSGSHPKGRGLTEIAVGSKVLLIHSLATHTSPLAPYINKPISARIKISHFPLDDSHPASQIDGPWITEITDLTARD